MQKTNFRKIRLKMCVSGIIRPPMKIDISVIVMFVRED